MSTAILLRRFEPPLGVLKSRYEGKQGKWVFPSPSSASGHLEEPKKVWQNVLKCATCKIWQQNDNLKALILKARKSLPEAFCTIDLFKAIQAQAKKEGVELPVGVLDIRLHDLRRTLGSWLAHSGANSFIIGKSLNHKSQKSTQVYARLSIDPVRASMNDAVRLMKGGS
jgi:integrase